MIKKLTRVGNSHAIVIDKPVLELLGIGPETPLEITTDGGRLIVEKAGLPELLRRCFWDCDFGALSWTEHRSFIVKRVLEVAGRDVVDWLRHRLGDDAIREVLVSTHARGLTYAQVRRWIPRRTYDRWLAANPNRSIWENR